jgi:hypothetical protein
MRKLLALAIIFFSLRSYGQNMGYQPGLIVTQMNDTMICMVPIAALFGEQITIKKKADSEEEIIPLNRIKYLATATNVYENVAYQKKGKTINKLMWLEIEGKLNLYLELLVNRSSNGSSSTIPVTGGGGSMEFFGPPIKTYVVRKGDSTFLIDEKKFIETISPVIYDNGALVSKVESKVFKFKDMEILIKEYNNATKIN